MQRGREPLRATSSLKSVITDLDFLNAKSVITDFAFSGNLRCHLHGIIDGFSQGWNSSPERSSFDALAGKG